MGLEKAAKNWPSLSKAITDFTTMILENKESTNKLLQKISSLTNNVHTID